MLVFRAGIHKFLVRVAIREDPIRLLLQKQSDLGLSYLPRPLRQVASVRNFRTFTICMFDFRLPAPTPPFKHLGVSVIMDAVFLSVVVFAISISMAKLLAKKHDYEVNPNQVIISISLSI